MPRLRILALAAAVLLAGGLGWWLVATATSPDPQSAVRTATDLAARLPTDRAAVVHPGLTDDPAAVPTYPAGTRITVDETTWLDNRSTASAYATVTPQNQRILVMYARYQGELYIAQIEVARS